MKRFIILLSAIILFILLISILIIFVPQKPAEDVVSLENVEIYIEDGTLTSTSATIIIENNSNNTYTTGDDYRIDQYLDGKWYKIKSKPMASLLPIYDINSEYPLVLNLNWKVKYGVLESGKYRIVKTLNPEENSRENIKIAVEFIIE